MSPSTPASGSGFVGVREHYRFKRICSLTLGIKSFAFETTLAGLVYLRHIARWLAQGYRVSLYFLSLSDAQTAIARVAERVRQGGHNIPEPVIRRRFAAGLANFERCYRAAVDDWTLYDSAGDAPIVLQWGQNP